MINDPESFTRIDELAPSKKCKKEQATVKQKSVSLTKVSQIKPLGPIPGIF